MAKNTHNHCFVCIECRHTGKFNGYSYQDHPCPFCGKLMMDCDNDFKPPRKDDLKGWRQAYQHLLDMFGQNPAHYLERARHYTRAPAEDPMYVRWTEWIERLKKALDDRSVAA